MKKFLICLALLVITLSCTQKYVIVNVHEKTFYDSESVIDDINATLYKYDMVKYKNMDLWMQNIITLDTLTIEQLILHKEMSETSVYKFILTKYIYPNRYYYTFLVRYIGHKKYLKNIEK